MTNLLITSSAKKTGSHSRTIARYLVENLKGDWVERDVATHPVAPVSADDLIAVHENHESLTQTAQDLMALSNTLIAELNDAENLVIATPMYNFSVPASLKQWIDHVCRAGITFKYTQNGPEGLLNTQRAYIITATGGTPVGSDMDYASKYLEHICRFLGINEIHHIDASGSKGNKEAIITSAKTQINNLLYH